MLDFLQASLQPKSEPFRQLTIERRVLITPKSTVSIASIASISLGTAGVPRRAIWNVALVLLVGGLASLAAGLAQKDAIAMALGAVAMIGGLILARFFASRELVCLSIASDGGHVLRFTGQRRILEEARRLLSDKINAADEDAVYRINFEKGMVQDIGQTDSVAAIFAGPGNPSFEGNGRGSIFDAHGHAPGPANGSIANGHYGGGNGHYGEGNGHYGGGNGLHVDYAPVLPHIVDMQRFYAQRQDTQDIAERLNELEYLLRSGTPTASSRSRVGQLVGELSSILGAYPVVVQIFQQAARLAEH
jgi:hypothetical protein